MPTKSCWAGYLTFMLLLLAADGLAAEPAAAPDWPQYRGPTRDGIAPAGPKLLDSWPKDGPPLLWKSATLWPVKGGIKANNSHSGCGSIAIAGGKAFIFANFRRNTGKEGKALLTTKDLNALGWMEGVPADLAKKVEEERIHGKGAKLQLGPELDAYARQYVAGLDPESAKTFGPWIERRLKKEPVPASFAPASFSRLLEPGGNTALNGDPVFEWKFLEKLAAIRDKEFTTIEEMDKQFGGDLNNSWGSRSGNAIRVLLTNRSNSYFDAIICLDAATGKELWRKELPGSISPYADLDVGASSTPAISAGKCYVAGSAGMYCLSANDGTVIWQAKTGFCYSSPLVMNGVVYVLVPEATAYDAKTGHVLWRQPSLNHADSSFAQWASGEKNYLITVINAGVYDVPQGGLYCLDPANGKTLWHTFCMSCSLPVIVGADTMVVNAAAFKITPDKVEPLWKGETVSRGGSPVVFRDSIYISEGCHSADAVRCLDLKTGKLNWNPHKFCAESSSPVLADGKIIALPEEDEGNLFVVMFRATPEKFEELGRFNPHAGPGASPSIAGGKLYLRLQDCIACYDLRAKSK